jgi:stage III sporulation protein AH
MSKWFSRSTVTLAALALLFAVAFGIRLFSGNTEPVVSIQKESAAPAAEEAQSASQTGDFFKDFRAQRETARADEIALLDSIVQRENAPEDSVKKADERRIELTRFTEQERAIEKLLVAKGFEDAAAFVQEGTATIVVKKEKLTDEEIARILEMAMRQTGQEASNIKIIPAG